jgi:hypothetical protein
MIRLRHIIVLGAVCALSTISNRAYAVPGEDVSFYPAEGWTITASKTINDYGGECVLKATFNNGFVITLNGASNWVQQLDIDISQNAFELGKTYTAKLSVPGVVNDTVQSVSNHASIISIPMKSKKNFYKAMRERAVLDVDIEGNEFRFYLTGFAAAGQNFETCMAGAAPGRVAATNPRNPIEEKATEKPKASSRKVVPPIPVKRTENVRKAVPVEDVDKEIIEKAAASNTVPVSASQAPKKSDELVVRSSDLSVSTSDWTQEQKDFLLNESIAFEKEEVELRNQNTPPEAYEPEAGDMDEDTTSMPSLPALLPEDKVQHIEVIEEQSSVVEELNGITMPASDIAAAEKFLAEPESPIETPKIKVNKQVIRAKADFTTPAIARNVSGLTNSDKASPQY